MTTTPNPQPSSSPARQAMDGMTAAAWAACALSDVAAIYPITPASHMAETVESWAAAGRPNLFGQPVAVKEMQSEKGVAGALHGALAGGALASTFTASQGLMLMIPNMYKIAGELLPGVFHITCRSLAAHALSIFGDHQDIMAVRATGVAMLASSSVQECMDLSLVAHLSAIEGSLPFAHFFDGFRTSDEICTIETIAPEAMTGLVNWDKVRAFRARAMDPEHPQIRGTAQNPDIYFQNREAPNRYYDALPGIVEKAMAQVAALTGRSYHAFDYVGAPDAERVVVAMGSSCSVVEQTVRHLNAQGEKVGLVKVRLYRPFDAERFVATLPASTRVVCALDRTKEPGSQGEPLLQDVCCALMSQGRGDVRAIGGRYGLSSKDFTPAMVRAVFDNMRDGGGTSAAAFPEGSRTSSTPHLPAPCGREPALSDGGTSAGTPMKPRFTVGIDDDVTHLSLPVGPELDLLEGRDLTQCIFYGFGSDGTVGASKEAAKIVSDKTGAYVQEYSWFDSKKSGGLTITYLRLGPDPIDTPYLIDHADYVACHKDIYVKRGYRMLDHLKEGGVFVLNAPWTTVDELERQLPAALRQAIAAKKARFYVIDASAIAAQVGLGARINMVMETAFFKLSGAMDFDAAVSALKQDVQVMYASKGSDVVAKNLQAIDAAAGAIVPVDYPAGWGTASEKAPEDEGFSAAKSQGGATTAGPSPSVGPHGGPSQAYLNDVFWPIERLEGNALPVSKLNPAGIVPPGTAAYEKRTVAFEIPEWDVTKCVQCYECSLVCPHAAIRPYLATDAELEGAPAGYATKKASFKGLEGLNLRIQVYPQDCVGCGSCADNCPAPGKALVMRPLASQLDEQRQNLAFAQANVSIKDELIPTDSIPGTQLQQPLLEFSGCCGGCGETPHVKLLTQLFGDRLIMANATGCSSIWGAYSPAMPYTVNRRGHGPAWGNSLFEDNGEYGYGIAKAVKVRRQHLVDLATSVAQAAETPTEVKTLLEAWIAVRDDADAAYAAGQAAQDALRSWMQGAEKTSGMDGISGVAASSGTAGAPDNGASTEAAAGSQGLLAQVREVLDCGSMFGKKSVWAVGGDGWAYDIGYGGLDEVLASGENLNVLVLDTEGYSNTGGEMSKATQLGSVSGFALDGKATPKKNLGRMMMAYGYVYVAQICLGANMQQAIDALREAENYDGPSIVIALCPCISWGLKAGMGTSIRASKEAVEAGYWPLFRFDPRLAQQGKNPLTVDCAAPNGSMKDFLAGQDRYARLASRKPELSSRLQSELAKDCDREYQVLSRTVGVYGE